MRIAMVTLALAGCIGGGPKDDCEIVPNHTCGPSLTTYYGSDTSAGAGADTGCPPGYACYGPPANVCYRGSCDLGTCLPPVAEIDTPDGPRPIRGLRVGDEVLTLGADGRTLVEPIVQLGSRAAGPGHEDVRVELADGRVVRGSPGHPTTDGRTLGDLATGDVLDGSTIEGIEREPYPFARTFDLLPDGPTGTYRADGVWLGSTLTGR